MKIKVDTSLILFVSLPSEPPSAPLNLILHHDDSVLLSWDPPHDSGGRWEVMYDLTCEEVVEAGGQSRTCGQEVVFLPHSAGLIETSVRILGLDPRSDYKLSVRAWNQVSGLQGAPPPSTTSIMIHRCK